jgi:FkbM family methyltransferase
VGQHLIRFSATSFIEYFLRAQESYTREQVTMHWINKYINSDDIVFDIGANVGVYSLLIGMKVVLGSGKVYAFEPEASNFSSLNRNIRLNNLGEKLLPYSIAFGDGKRVSKFFLQSTVPGSSLHGIDRPESKGVPFESEHIQGVYIMTVDEFVGEQGVEFPNHIKIDVDGAEKGIVKNMKGVLSDHRLQTIMIEIDIDVSSGEIEATIEDANFFEVMREQVGTMSDQVNVLYVRKTHQLEK